MARFTRDWTDASFRAFADPPPGSQVIATGGDGGDGIAGEKGKPGDQITAPGQGSDGAFGGFGGFASVFASGLTFSKNHPIGDWLLSATGGNGGRGGNGGDAGKFPPHHEYGVSWPGGGDGGDAGDAGTGEATVSGATIYGRTGTGAADGIGLTVQAIGGVGGRGGDGGNADGKNGSPSAGGGGGRAGDGGNGSGAQVVVFNTTFDHTNNAADPNHFVTVLNVSARGGNGGRGGDGGAAGKGTPAGDDGPGGDGGDGGDATVNMHANTFDMSHGGGGSSLLSIIFNVKGGNAGNGGAAGGPSGATGLGGGGGDAGISFTENEIHGGAENDTVRLAFHVTGGQGGVSGDGTLHTTNGGGGVELDNCVFDGGNGHNALLFSWAAGDTNVEIIASLISTKLSVGTGVSSIVHFQDVTGGSADDILIGDNNTNALNGAAGDDFLQGGLASDTLTGAAGADQFVFIEANESTSTARDRITDLNFDQDSIGVDFDVVRIDNPINEGVSNASFDSDIAGAVGVLKFGHAKLVTAIQGSLDGHQFLVIGADSVKGYQAGSDIVIDITGFTGTMKIHDFFNAH